MLNKNICAFRGPGSMRMSERRLRIIASAVVALGCYSIRFGRSGYLVVDSCGGVVLRLMWMS